MRGLSRHESWTSLVHILALKPPLCVPSWYCRIVKWVLTHWSRDKMDAISQTIFDDIPIDDIPPLVQIMAWRWLGDEPLSDSMMFSLLTHICVTRLQWVKDIRKYYWKQVHMIPSLIPFLRTSRFGNALYSNWTPLVAPAFYCYFCRKR